MTDNVIGFKPRERKAGTPEVIGSGEVADFAEYDVGKIELPQPDGASKYISFDIELAAWYSMLCEMMFTTMPQGPYGRIFFAMREDVLKDVPMYQDPARSLSLTLTRPQFYQLTDAMPFMVLEDGVITNRCQLSTAEHVLKYADEVMMPHQMNGDLTSAIFITQLDENRFRLTYIEQ